jgi:uncharacterized protein YndB with AHSA1/START domain
MLVAFYVRYCLHVGNRLEQPQSRWVYRPEEKIALSDYRGVIERKLFIDATPETVFGFLTDPALMARWIGLSHTLDARPGGIFRVELPRGNIAVGVFTEVKPHRRVAFTWGWESAEAALAVLKPGSSLVEIELEAENGGTLLRFRHSGLPEGLQTMLHTERWFYYLDRLNQAARLASSK